MQNKQVQVAPLQGSGVCHAVGQIVTILDTLPQRSERYYCKIEV